MTPAGHADEEDVTRYPASERPIFVEFRKGEENPELGLKITITDVDSPYSSDSELVKSIGTRCLVDEVRGLLR